MKIVICGAGEVGSSIASDLCSESNDVTIIDNNANVITEMNQKLDARAIHGHASHPDTLEKAGLKDADMIIAATSSDEINMIACQIAHTLFNVPKKIARIRSGVYRDPAWGDLFSTEHMPIDVIISPELEVANAINDRLIVPGSFNVMTFEKDQMRIIGVICEEGCPINNTPLKHIETLFPDLNVKILSIVRDEGIFIPEEDDQIIQGDEVYFITETSQTDRAMAVFGHEEPEARRILIIGGGNIGFYLAKKIRETQPSANIKIIEQSEERALEIHESFEKTIVVHGDALQSELLEEVGITKIDAVITVTNDDETNILSGLLAKKYGAKRAIALVNKKSYAPIISDIGLDTIVSPRATTVATILHHVRRGKIKAVRRLREEMAEVIEIEATEKSKIIHRPIKDIDFPESSILAAIFRRNNEENRFIIPGPDDEIMPKDRVIFLNLQGSVQLIEELFTDEDSFF